MKLSMKQIERCARKIPYMSRRANVRTLDLGTVTLEYVAPMNSSGFVM